MFLCAYFIHWIQVFLIVISSILLFLEWMIPFMYYETLMKMHEIHVLGSCETFPPCSCLLCFYYLDHCAVLPLVHHLKAIVLYLFCWVTQNKVDITPITLPYENNIAWWTYTILKSKSGLCVWSMDFWLMWISQFMLISMPLFWEIAWFRKHTNIHLFRSADTVFTYFLFLKLTFLKKIKPLFSNKW